MYALEIHRVSRAIRSISGTKPRSSVLGRSPFDQGALEQNDTGGEAKQQQFAAPLLQDCDPRKPCTLNTVTVVNTACEEENDTAHLGPMENGLNAF